MIALCLAAAFAFGAKSAKEAYDRGVAAQNRGDYQEAIKQYTEAIKADPKLAIAYAYRGMAYYNLGDYKQAITDCNQAIEIDPKLAMAYSVRSDAHLALGDDKNAEKDGRKACELEMTHAYCSP
ncbi:MAG: tetratricopeptide repeat protein, partial [Helicobacteraceae bacterium]|nr:tetratricopeptide repeat protein [Helicobacteraceae bacterium]